VQELIDGGLVLVNGKAAKSSQKLHGVKSSPCGSIRGRRLRAEAESISLDVLYEDTTLSPSTRPLA